MDISGETQTDIAHNIVKARLTPTGEHVPDGKSKELRNDIDKLNEQRSGGYCGSCYGGVAPDSGCCNTCEDVRLAYVNRGWSFSQPEAIEQCVQEGWSEKLKDQASEGCNIAGIVRVNKVVGNIHLSPGRSFRTASQNIYELVPYLKEDGNRHDFTHEIHSFAFQGDDEYDWKKADASNRLRSKLGISNNPLDGTISRVCAFDVSSGIRLELMSDIRPASKSICSNTSSKSYPLNSVLLTAKLYAPISAFSSPLSLKPIAVDQYPPIQCHAFRA